jgi:hypothetical protein
MAFDIGYWVLFPFVLSQSKHKIDLGNSPLPFDIASFLTLCLGLRKTMTGE